MNKRAPCWTFITDNSFPRKEKLSSPRSNISFFGSVFWWIVVSLFIYWIRQNSDWNPACSLCNMQCHSVSRHQPACQTILDVQLVDHRDIYVVYECVWWAFFALGRNERGIQHMHCRWRAVLPWKPTQMILVSSKICITGGKVKVGGVLLARKTFSRSWTVGNEPPCYV